MKKISFIVMLFAAWICSTTTVWGQVSTEGKEFWVALTLSAAPSSGLPEPFIAVSTKKPNTTITITNPNNPNWAGVTRTVGANQWETFTIDDIPMAQWYPTTANSINNIKSQAGQGHNFGLKVVTSEEVSVFAALWMENSFDAANILPMPVLQSEYFTQDYPPYIKPSDGDALSMFTILAVENNTHVRITPSSTTQDNKPANQSYMVNLNAGQTYYVISQTLQSLSGTHVEALSGKKIAIFQGDVFTQIPGGKAARDCTYEQAMPVDFWGSEFVVTRSKKKDANRIRVTAMEDGTQLWIDGNSVSTINMGETYEFEMSVNPISVTPINKASVTVKEDAVYLKSSCPVAVYSYDVSNGYSSSPTEMENSQGDPSMVWISPLEQRISEITFGVCGTSKTDLHYIDIVCKTDEAAQTTISPAPEEAFNWIPVNGNPDWSYTRVWLAQLKKPSKTNTGVFTLKNPDGFIAHVYGNGNDESYAYSVGSAAVKRGVKVEGKAFIDGYRYENPFCMGSDLSFDAQISAGEIITKVDWNFGDGVSELNGSPQTNHIFDSPGWYDVTAKVYPEKRCPEGTTLPAEEVRFSFYINKPDTISEEVFKCLEEMQDYQFEGKSYWSQVQGHNEDMVIYDTITAGDCDKVYTLKLNVFAPKDTIVTEQVHDNYLIPGGYDENGNWQDEKWIESSVNGVVRYRKRNGIQTSCYNFKYTYNIKIVTCLQVNSVSPVAERECSLNQIHIQYQLRKGSIGKADLLYGNNVLSNGVVGTSDITFQADNAIAGVYQGWLRLFDAITDPAENCAEYVDIPIQLNIPYSSDIFAKKFGNTLAVYGNKGYIFTAFQWYKYNDMGLPEPIPGATESVYSLPKDSLLEGTYFVLLADQKGQVLRSCERTFTPSAQGDQPSYETTYQPLAAPETRKVMRGQQLLIEVDGVLYDTMGNRVE